MPGRSVILCILFQLLLCTADAAAVNCAPEPTTSFGECSVKIDLCAQEGIPMKFGRPGCREFSCLRRRAVR